MVRYNISFTRKLTAEINVTVASALYSLQDVSACAGIRNNRDAAFKARVNHHGAPMTNVPARRFVYDATRNIGDQKFGSEIAAIIKDALRTPEVRRQTTTHYKDRIGTLQTRTEDPRRDKPFGSFDPSNRNSMLQRTPNRIMTRIAKQMAANQRKAIAERAYISAANNGNDPAHNTPRVAKHKGFDWPLVDSGAMLNSVEAWTE